MKENNIFVLDDEPIVTESIKSLVELETDYKVMTSTNPFEALETIKNNNVKVIITDFLMPEMNGIDFLIEVKKITVNTSLIILTGYADKDNAIRAVNEIGIFQYIEKPWNNKELLNIIKNAIERGDLLTELQIKCNELHDAYVGTIFRLATAAEMYDEKIFSHVLRIGLLSKKLADLSGEDECFCNDIKYASMMHDVGKIGIPKKLLNKKNKLNEEEFKIMKCHTEIGSYILRNPENQLLEMANEIAQYHHEKWNGLGYPKGLKGLNIPKSARIVAIADMFDALLSERSYKSNFQSEKVHQIIEKEIGIHLDPDITQLLLDNFSILIKIFKDVSSKEGEDLSKILFQSNL